MKISFWGFALAALSALSLSVPASGAVITQYSDRASWEAATAGRVDIDFSRNESSSLYYTSSLGVNFSSPAVNFVGFYNEGSSDQHFLGWSNASSVPDHNPAWQFTFGGNSTGGILAGGTGTANNGFTRGIIASMGSNSGVRMLAFDFAALRFLNSNGNAQYPLTGALQLVVYENNVATTTINLSNNAAQVLSFVGIRTDGDISGVRLITSNTALAINATAIMDNFSFGTVAQSQGGGGGGGELPEPATFLTAAAACLLFSISRYWKN
jgi:hypothetical protein